MNKNLQQVRESNKLKTRIVQILQYSTFISTLPLEGCDDHSSGSLINRTKI